MMMMKNWGYFVYLICLSNTVNWQLTEFGCLFSHMLMVDMYTISPF